MNGGCNTQSLVLIIQGKYRIYTGTRLESLRLWHLFLVEVVRFFFGLVPALCLVLEPGDGLDMKYLQRAFFKLYLFFGFSQVCVLQREILVNYSLDRNPTLYPLRCGLYLRYRSSLDIQNHQGSSSQVKIMKKNQIGVILRMTLRISGIVRHVRIIELFTSTMLLYQLDESLTDLQT